MNNNCISCSSSRVALFTFKEMAHDMTCESTSPNAFKGECRSSHFCITENMIKLLLSTCFKANANKNTLVLSRRVASKNLILKIVKDRKNNGTSTVKSKRIMIMMHQLGSASVVKNS